MYRRFILASLAVAAALPAVPSHAAESRIVERGGFTIEFRDYTNAVDQAVADGIIEILLTTYPRLVRDFNPAARRRVTVTAIPGYRHPAAAHHGFLYFNPKWFNTNKGDVDTWVHEAMHIVQGYGYGDQPAWIVEGIADFARLKYSTKPDFTLLRFGRFDPKGTSYSDSYSVTALFLHWLDRNGYPGIAQKLDARLRRGPYSPRMWRELTGKDVDTLWAECVKGAGTLQAEYDAALAPVIASVKAEAEAAKAARSGAPEGSPKAPPPKPR